MFQVSGKVLVKELGVGVPDLVIVLHDLNLTPANPSHGQTNKPAGKSTGLDLTTFWQTVDGSRLGSVLTDSNGEFELSFEASQLASGKGGKGADLLLIVMAPEENEVSSDKNIYRPKSPQKRILYFSQAPILKSGWKESFVIRLTKELLDQHDIRYPTPPGPVSTDAQSVELMLKQADEKDKGIQAALQSRAREKLGKFLEARENAKEALKDFTFSKYSPEFHDTNHYWKPGDSLLDKQTNLVKETLGKISNELDAGVTRKFEFTGPKEEGSAQFAMTADSDEGVTRSMSLTQVLNFFRSSLEGSSLVRMPSPLLKCRLEDDADRRYDDTVEACTPSTETSPAAETPTDSEETTPVEDQSVMIKDMLERLLSTTSPETGLSYNVEENGSVIGTVPSPGPADQTAYHDFHHLQIAFENVWAEAFDEELGDMMMDVYTEMVRYSQQVSGTGTLPAVFNERDFEREYKEFRALQEEIESDSREEDATIVSAAVPPSVQRMLPEITGEVWAAMSSAEHTILTEKANRYEYLAPYLNSDDPSLYSGIQREIDRIRGEARVIVDEVMARIEERRAEVERRRRPRAANPRLTNLMVEIDQRLAEPHRFDIFAPDSLNFGLMFTYRQTWVPLNYQVGDLVRTLPLAPKEVRKYTTKQIIKKGLVRKEIEDAQSSRKVEASVTERAESEIVRRASQKTSFQQTAGGRISYADMIEVSFGTTFGTEAEKSSSDTRKNFREAVLKSAEEYKQQHRLEVETTITSEEELTSAGEIMNPNEEITVTYLFYELQRQYEISEQLHRVTPVVLVANSVPKPNWIDDDWILSHDWILRRVILDDSFLPALDYVSNNAVGDNLVLEERRNHLRKQANLVDELIRQTKLKSDLAVESWEQFRQLMSTATGPSDFERMQNIGLALVFGPIALFGMGDDNSDQKREEIAKLSYERADKGYQEVNAKLTREVTALNEALDKYIIDMRDYMDRQMAIARLRIHIKQNILYYMQAIWDYEPPDQRFFRLYNIDVPWIVSREEILTVTVVTGPPWEREYHVVTIPMTIYEIQHRKLHEVADLDNLMGFKGNYMIFPAKEPSLLHMYLMQDYFDPETGGVREPGVPNYTAEELLGFICCKQGTDPSFITEHADELREKLKEVMTSYKKDKGMVVIPTGSLYIEALPGSHPLLEKFKLVHRQLDVKKVQAEVRRIELENVRLAARLLSDELEDPDIERKIVIEGGSEMSVEVDAGGGD